MPRSLNLERNLDNSGADSLLRRHSWSGEPTVRSAYISSDIVSSSVTSVEPHADPQEPSSPSGWAFAVPKFVSFVENFKRARNEDLANQRDTAIKWNEQINATIKQLKQPTSPAVGVPSSRTDAPPLGSAGRAPLYVEIAAEVGAAQDASRPVSRPNFVAIRNLFTLAEFPNFDAKITTVHAILQDDGKSIESKIDNLLSLKEKTDLFPWITVKALNLAEIMRDTARSSSGYVIEDRKREKEELISRQSEAKQSAQEALTLSEKNYKEKNNLLQELLRFEAPLSESDLRSLHKRYLEISEDTVSDTTYEAFIIGLHDDDNPHLTALNEMVADAREDWMKAQKRLDDVEATCSDFIEKEIDFFESTKLLQTPPRCFIHSFKIFNDCKKKYYEELLNKISNCLRDKDQNPLMRAGVIALLVTSVAFWFLGKTAQFIGAAFFAVVAAGLATFVHSIFSLGPILSKPCIKLIKWYKRRNIVPIDAKQINKDLIANSERKLVITRFLLELKPPASAQKAPQVRNRLSVCHRSNYVGRIGGGRSASVGVKVAKRKLHSSNPLRPHALNQADIKSSNHLRTAFREWRLVQLSRKKNFENVQKTRQAHNQNVLRDAFHAWKVNAKNTKALKSGPTERDFQEYAKSLSLTSFAGDSAAYSMPALNPVAVVLGSANLIHRTAPGLTGVFTGHRQKSQKGLTTFAGGSAADSSPRTPVNRSGLRVASPAKLNQNVKPITLKDQRSAFVTGALIQGMNGALTKRMNEEEISQSRESLNKIATTATVEGHDRAASSPNRTETPNLSWRGRLHMFFNPPVTRPFSHPEVYDENDPRLQGYRRIAPANPR